MLIKIEQNMPRIKALEDNIASLGDSIKIDKLGEDIASLEAATAEAGFWNDAENSRKVLSELKRKKA
ncbi:MAG: hypothetical protein J6T77_00915, partial [Clostridia bacterium]|nr:hypothetical protein [Clostridia bacterium]